MISHMGNETGFLSGKNPGEGGCSDIISSIGFLSLNTSPGVICRLLKRNKSRDGFSKCKYESWHGT